jgi:hypothetical protein
MDKKSLLKIAKRAKPGSNLKSIIAKNEQMCNDKCHKTYAAMEKNACDCMMGKTKNRSGTLLG